MTAFCIFLSENVKIKEYVKYGVKGVSGTELKAIGTADLLLQLGGIEIL